MAEEACPASPEAGFASEQPSGTPNPKLLTSMRFRDPEPSACNPDLSAEEGRLAARPRLMGAEAVTRMKNSTRLGYMV